jgi:hypothetical protein
MLTKQMILQEVVIGFTCDRCGKIVSDKDFEYSEAHHVDFVGGYASVFGDGTKNLSR